MTQDFRDENILRDYLLGTLTDEAQAMSLEERLLCEGALYEQLSILEEELIDDYLDGVLSDEEKQKFDQYFLASDERCRKLEFSRALRRRLAAQKTKDAAENVSRPKRRQTWSFRSLSALTTIKATIAILLVLGAGFTVWRFLLFESDSDKGLKELRALYTSQRPFESRLSNFDYAPFSATRGNEKSDADTVARDSAALKLLAAAKNEPGAKSFHALGNYYLTEKQLDKALSQFDAALKFDSGSAQLYNDYGVALIEKAKTVPPGAQDGKRLENMARALEHFVKAVEINPSLLEAIFNKALCLQQMNLPEQTKKAWREYLEKDSSSPWAEEAQRHLQQLETQTLSSAKTPHQVLADFFAAFERRDDERAWQIVSQTREMISDAMIFFQLTRAFLNADADDKIESANNYLAAMRFVAELEKKNAGDAFFYELAEFYASSDRADRPILFQAQNKIKTGYRLTQESKYTEAATAFSEARELFAKTGNHWESELSNYWVGYLYHRIAEADAALRELSAVEQYCQQNKYQWLHSQVLGWLAQIAFEQNEISKSGDYLKTALEITKEISDTYNQQKVLARLGGLYKRTGKLQKALAQIEQSFEIKQDYFSSSRQTWRNCNAAAEILYQLKLYNSAISFGEEALQIGIEKMTDSTANHSSYYTLSLLYGGAQQYRKALDFAEKSLLSIGSVKANDKRLLTNFSLLRTAHLYRQSGDCEESIKIYENIVRETAEQGSAQIDLNNYEARKGRLLCYFALNREDLIADELPAVMNLYEKYRAQILDEQIRNSFFDNEQSIYDLAINFEHSRNNSQGAFDAAETSKARSLLDLFHGKALVEKTGNELDVRLNQVASPLSLNEIQSRLPEQAQVVQYAVLSDKILIYFFTRTQFRVVERKISSSEIGEKATVFLKNIAARNRLELKADGEAMQLYDILISPVLPFLDSGKKICLIPDKMLYQLPFAALISPTSGRFLIEEFTILSAPSASMLVLSSEAAARRKGSDDKENILSVGNPHFNKREFSDLADLPDAEREAVEIAEYYQTPKTLIGDVADKQTFLSELASNDVVHFAGHYVVNESFPLRSKFLLAQGQEKQSGDVEVHEILERDLSSVKLAVLSACRTGIENYYNGEGMIGVSRSFLAGGVPLVVASQWAVDSDATAELMIKFHSRRKQQRLSSAMALRRAQIEMLNAPNQRFNSPYYWAGFLPIGGFTEY